MPLVVDFHGAGSNMNEQAVYSGFDPLADEEGFVVATPEWHRRRGAPVALPRGAGRHRLRRGGRRRPRRERVRRREPRLRRRHLERERDVGVARVPGVGHVRRLRARRRRLLHPATVRHRRSAPDRHLPRDRRWRGALRRRPGAAWRRRTSNPQRSPRSGGRRTTAAPAGPTRRRSDTEVVRLDWTGCEQPVVMYRIVGGGHTWPGSHRRRARSARRHIRSTRPTRCGRCSASGSER